MRVEVECNVLFQPSAPVSVIPLNSLFTLGDERKVGTPAPGGVPASCLPQDPSPAPSQLSTTEERNREFSWIQTRLHRTLLLEGTGRGGDKGGGRMCGFKCPPCTSTILTKQSRYPPEPLVFRITGPIKNICGECRNYPGPWAQSSS